MCSSGQCLIKCCAQLGMHAQWHWKIYVIWLYNVAELGSICTWCRLETANQNLATNFQNGWPLSNLWSKKSKKRARKESNAPRKQAKLQQLAALVTSQVSTAIYIISQALQCSIASLPPPICLLGPTRRNLTYFSMHDMLMPSAMAICHICRRRSHFCVGTPSSNSHIHLPAFTPRACALHFCFLLQGAMLYITLGGMPSCAGCREAAQLAAPACAGPAGQDGRPGCAAPLPAPGRMHH